MTRKGKTWPHWDEVRSGWMEVWVLGGIPIEPWCPVLVKEGSDGESSIDMVEDVHHLGMGVIDHKVYVPSDPALLQYLDGL